MHYRYMHYILIDICVERKKFTTTSICLSDGNMHYILIDICVERKKFTTTSICLSDGKKRVLCLRIDLEFYDWSFNDRKLHYKTS